MTNEHIVLFAKAAHFAAVKHKQQRRKGEAAEPYINHLTEVAETLAVYTSGKDIDLVVAGLLHDTLEDTETSYQELVVSFGVGVADLVKEVTDDKTLQKAERKRMQVKNAPHKSNRARMIKIADKLSNLNSILHSPPDNWTLERKREYFEWANLVVSGCKGVNLALEQAFDEVFDKGMKKLA